MDYLVTPPDMLGAIALFVTEPLRMDVVATLVLGSLGPVLTVPALAVTLLAPLLFL